MSSNFMHDYDQVRVILNEGVVDPLADEVITPDLSFTFGTLTSQLPVVFFYSSDELDERIERACEEAGVLTCGAVGSKIPMVTMDNLVAAHENQQLDMVCLYETLDPTSRDSVRDLTKLSSSGAATVVGCSISVRHGRALANELRIASALLVGPTRSSIFKDIDTLGMATPRVSLVQDLSRDTDVPIFVTAASATETCKALVAGADAVVVNIGGPFEPDEDVKFVVDAVSKSLHENIERLCKLSGAKTPQDLAFRCRLTPVR